MEACILLETQGLTVGVAATEVTLLSSSRTIWSSARETIPSLSMSRTAKMFATVTVLTSAIYERERGGLLIDIIERDTSREGLTVRTLQPTAQQASGF